PFSMDESAVRALFEKHGAVQSVALINDRDTGRPRGFGFVEMASADAARAMAALNGHDVDGRALKVNEAQERTGGGGMGGGKTSPREAPPGLRGRHVTIPPPASQSKVSPLHSATHVSEKPTPTSWSTFRS